MALTVEELQIVLSCDATTAQSVLEKMDATVKAYTEKFQKYFDSMGGKGSGSKAGSGLNNVGKNASNAAKRVQDLSEAMRNVERNEYKVGKMLSTSDISSKINENMKKWANKDMYKNAAKEVEDIYSEMFSSGKSNMADWIPGGGGEQLFKLADTIKTRLQDSVGGVDSMPDTLKYKIESVIQTINNLGSAYRKALDTNGAGDKGTIGLQKKFEMAVNEADRYIQKLDQIAAKEQQVEAEAASEPTRLQTAISSIQQKIQGIGNAFRSVGQGISDMGARMKKAFQSSLLGRFVKQLGRTMMRMAAMKLIRGTIQGVKQGLQELAKTSESSAKAMNTISAAGGSIKMALGVAVMPIVKALAPLFYALAAAINTAANAIARFFAVLTGQGTYTATEFSGSLDGVSKAAGGAGKAVKGMLADFDELHVIQNQGGGGGGGGGVADSLSKVTGDVPATSKFAEMVKRAFETADFTSVGTVISNKLAIALASISWDKISETLTKVATSIATLINGIFANMRLADLIGSTIGKAFTTAYETVTTLIGTINWSDIGKFLMRALQNAVKNFNFSSVGKFISQKLIAVFSFKAGLYKGIDWKGLPKLLLEKITQVVSGFDFKGVAKAIGTWLGSGCRAAIDFLWGLTDLLSDIMRKIKEYFNQHIEDAKEAGGSIWDGICAGIKEAISTIWTWVKDNIWTPFVNAFKQAFGIASPAKTMIEPGKMVALGILEGIKNGLQKIGDIFVAFKDIVTGHLGIAFEYVKAFFVTLVDFVSTRGSLIKLNVEKWMAQMKAFIYNGLATFVESLTGGPLEKILKIIGVDLSGAASSLRQKANEANTKVGELDESIASAQKKAKQGFDINAHVDSSKVEEYKKQISKGISALVTLTADASALKQAIKSAMSMKFSMVFRVPGQSAKTGSIETRYIGLALEKGGLAYGLTPAVIGEYAGASSNPEVVAPLSKLQSILERSNVGGKDTMTRDQANTMINLLQRIEQKDLSISPSVGFGQVVQRSLDAYSRA